MTFRTSLFNKGIYKSTVRRFIWGAVLYAIILFMITSLPILSSVNPEYSYWASESQNEMLLSGEYLTIPLFLTLVIPTVVALLAFRFIHSKRNTVFVHSLPVTRTANLISTIAAAFTLMFVPVILNGIILSVISLCGYNELFSISGVLIWTGYNLLAIFLMFSAATFVSFLTGNTFAAVGLNILLHIIVLIFAGCFSGLAVPFLYGYVESNAFLDAASEWNFVTYIMTMTENFNRTTGQLNPFDWVKFSVLIASALAFYIAAWLLYKKRRTETAEDIAAYAVLNPIFKYLISFIAAVGACGIGCTAINEAPALPVVLTVIIGAVVYFALEMVLKKTLKVWGAYKGYLALLAVVAAVVFVFAGTSFFGFEGRVPEVSEVAEVTVADYRPYGSEEKYSSSPAVIEYVVNMHSELTSPEMCYAIDGSDSERYFSIYIKYKLNDGRELERRYGVDSATYYKYISALFEAEGYREAFVDVFRVDESTIYSVDINHTDMNALTQSQRRELLALLREDVLNMNYYEYQFNAWTNSIGFRAARDDESEYGGSTRYAISINANFEKSVAWLAENGYGNMLFGIANDLVVVPKPRWDEYMDLPAQSDMPADARVPEAVYSKESPKISSFTDLRVISSLEEKFSLRDLVLTHGGEFAHEKNPTYYVCEITESGYLNIVARIYDDAAAEIKKFM